MKTNEILELLRKNNPFVSSASPLPWENTNPDLLQLNREASEYIEQLILYKRRQPSVPLAGLVLGEAGSGKTHMLMRILKRLRSNARSTVFVAVKTFISPESAAQHLLNEIFISLKRIHSKGRTQFDMVMSEFWDAYQEHRRQDDFSDSEIKKLDPRTYIMRDIPGLEKNFLKCLLVCLSPKDDSTRSDVLDWLNEGLDDEDSLRLGLPSRDLSSMNDSKREYEAQKVLTALGFILSYAKVPMIVCFDQLDAMKDRKIIEAWGNIISILMNDLSGILPLCFIRSEIWNDVFMTVLDDAVVQRLQNNKIVMKTCSLTQARQLIYSRIKSFFEDDAEEFSKCLLEKMGKTLSDGYSPRMVIELANRAINTDTEPAVEGVKDNEPDEIYKQIKEIYENEYKKIKDAPEAWPPNSEQLALALETWLKSFDGFEVRTSKIKNITITADYNDKKFAFIIVTSKSHFVATAGLKQGISLINHDKKDFCFYISEKKLLKPGYKQARAALAEFEEAGGRPIMLDDESRIQWYALTSLINRTENGDVNLYLSSGNRPAVIDDIKDFIKSLKLISTKIIDPVPTGINSAALSNILSEFVEASPMRMLSVNKAVDLLSQRNIKMTADELLTFAGNEKTFKAYKSQDNTPIITFSKKA